MSSNPDQTQEFIELCSKSSHPSFEELNRQCAAEARMDMAHYGIPRALLARPCVDSLYSLTAYRAE